MSHCTKAQCVVSVSALISNFSVIHTLSAGRAIGLVIKGDAYGHGACGVARIFDADARVDYFLTAGLAEALELRHAGIHKPIMAMAYCDGDIAQALASAIEPSVATDYELDCVYYAAKNLQKVVPIHIKVDTGIARRGVAWQELGEFFSRAVAREYISVKSIFTHCADSSPEDPSYMYQQQVRYEEALIEARARGFTGMAHMASSGSLTLIPQYDMVRVGTMLYGSWKNEMQKNRVRARIPSAELIPALTLRAPSILQSERTVVLGIGYRDAYCIAPDARLIFSCGCNSLLTAVNERTSSAWASCTHRIEYADLLGVHPEISPTAAALRHSTIANEITTRIYTHLPRSYVSF